MYCTGSINFIRLKVHQMNVYTVFLNAKLKEEVYIETSPGFLLSLGRVNHLDKCVYDLNESLRE